MNERERYVKSLLFEDVDKVFFSPGGPRESTLRRWRQEGLPPDVYWYDYILDKELGIKIDKPQFELMDFKVFFSMIPGFEEKVLEHKDRHYIVQDVKGTIVEISDNFDVTYLRAAKDFVTRKYIKFPVENIKDWGYMKKRYDANDPSRMSGNLKELSSKLRDRDYVLRLGIAGPFWQMRDWCGFENLCMFMATDQDFVMEMVEFWKNFVLSLLRRIKGYISYDSVVINEDMAYKMKSMISPAMVRKYLMPVWSAWADILKESGCKVVMLDSDGYIEELIPLWIESGINCCIPIEIAAGNDPVKIRKHYGKNMGLYGGIDKRLIAKGGKALENEVYRVVPQLLKDGGYIPSCDHGVPPDISWRNFVEYARLLARLQGWL